MQFSFTHDEMWRDRLFVFWTGTNEMSGARKRCFETLTRTEANVVLVDQNGLGSWVLGSHPLHPAYPHLSLVHRSDYLRAYFMHHYGGGYSDIKQATSSWRPAFTQLAQSSAMGAGYPELHRGVAKIARTRVGGRCYFVDRKSSYIHNYLYYKMMRAFHAHLIGNCSFIFKPKTTITFQWLNAVEKRLDLLFPLLERNPARHPKERAGVDYGDGLSRYPVPWTFLLGDILAPLSFRYRWNLLRCLPQPKFDDYE